MSIKVSGYGKIYNIKNFGKVVSMSLGSSRKVKGEFVTDYFNLKILGEDNVNYFVQRNFAEKDKVDFTGRLVVNSWEKDGVKKSTVEIIVDTIEISQQQKEEIARFDTSSIPF